MILVLLGTNPYSFSRLAKAIDEYAGENGEECYIQLGHTPYVPKYSSFDKFIDKQDLLKKIEDADFVVTQGGFGSIADCVRAGKIVIAVPRKPELGESPDRQEELVRELENLGKLIGVYEIDNLSNAIRKANATDFSASEDSRIPSMISQFIQDNR